LRKSPLRREIAEAISERSRAVKVPTRGTNGVAAQKFHRSFHNIVGPRIRVFVAFAGGAAGIGFKTR